MPSPDVKTPITMSNGDVWPYTVFLKNVIDHPNIQVGDYTYYNDFSAPADYARTLAPYLHPGCPEQLIIGKYVQIAHGTQFITSSANHQMNGFSTYPFKVFAGEWDNYTPCFPAPKDTVVGHDVWLGHNATVMPGITIGAGAIIGTQAVVSRPVPPYAVVVGNPARVVRYRFDEKTIAALLEIAWWDWPADKVTRHLDAIVGADLDKLIRTT